MARTRLNPQLAKLNRNYSVEEVASLYGLNRMTVRRWHKDHGLEAIDDRRPILFTGPVLRAFVAKRRAAAKRPTPPGKLHCFRCRDARAPALGMADFTPSTGGVTGNLRALCETCDAVMNRRARWAAVPEILPGIEVRVVQREGRIAEPSYPSLNVTFEKDGRP